MVGTNNEKTAIYAAFIAAGVSNLKINSFDCYPAFSEYVEEAKKVGLSSMNIEGVTYKITEKGADEYVKRHFSALSGEIKIRKSMGSCQCGPLEGTIAWRLEGKKCFYTVEINQSWSLGKYIDPKIPYFGSVKGAIKEEMPFVPFVKFIRQ